MTALFLLLLAATDAGTTTTTIDFEEDEAPVEIIRGEEERPGFDAGIPAKYRRVGGAASPESTSGRRGCAGCDAGALALVGGVLAARRRGKAYQPR